MNYSIKYHKRNNKNANPNISLILLDWSVREQFHIFEWLDKQDVPRESYELIWVELYNRILPEVLEKSDVVITLNQKKKYHKHIGYNAGLLEAKGKVITICDSDAVFPENFVSSVSNFFGLNNFNNLRSAILMHYQWRTKSFYPKDLNDISELSNYKWLDLLPNVGACMSVLKDDAIRFGGFDEHKSYYGYLCGPYELGWRMINAGIPEVWHDESVALWHFAHPDPHGALTKQFSMKRWKEITYPHVDHHALTAVEGFSTGRMLPLKENPEIFELRMSRRMIGTEFEKKYAIITGPNGFRGIHRLKLYISFLSEPFMRMLYINLWESKLFDRIFGRDFLNSLKRKWKAINHG